MTDKIGGERTTISRRDLLRATAAAGLGGLVVGGGGGFLLSRGGGTAAGPAGGAARAPLHVVGINALEANPLGSEESRNGAQLAIKEINGFGGVLGGQLVYSEVDYGDAADPAKVRAGFERAVERENPDVIVAQGPVAIGPDYEVTADAEVLYLNGNTREDWRELYNSSPDRYWNSFQYDPSELAYGSGFALFLNDLVESGKFRAQDKTVSVVAGDEPYGSSIARVFEETIKPLGWTITGKDLVTPGTVADWGPIFSRVRAQNPAVLFSTTYAINDNAAMAKQFAANPMKDVLVYQQYGPSEPEYLDLAGESANGVVWSTVLGIQVDPIGEAYRDRYRAEYGKEPGWSYAGGMYDAVWIWAKAAALAGDAKDTRAVGKMIESLVHRGVTGGIFLDQHIQRAFPAETKDPSLGQPHIIVQIQNGEHKVIYPEPFTNAEFQIPPWMAA